MPCGSTPVRIRGTALINLRPSRSLGGKYSAGMDDSDSGQHLLPQLVLCVTNVEYHIRRRVSARGAQRAHEPSTLSVRALPISLVNLGALFADIDFLQLCVHDDTQVDLAVRLALGRAPDAAIRRVFYGQGGPMSPRRAASAAAAARSLASAGMFFMGLSSCLGFRNSP